VSHRTEQGLVADLLEIRTLREQGRRPTGDEYREHRRRVAAWRRAAAERERSDMGASRAELRAERRRLGVPVRARLWWPSDDDHAEVLRIGHAR
jgi:hypothetical protein